MHTHDISGSLSGIAGQVSAQHSHGDSVVRRKQRRELVRDAWEDVPQLCQLMRLRKLAHDAHKLQRKLRLLSPAAWTGACILLHQKCSQPSQPPCTAYMLDARYAFHRRGDANLHVNQGAPPE